MPEPLVPTLHAEHSVYAPPHAISWMTLCFSAGAVNAGAFLVTDRFASHVTGTLSLIGLDLEHPWLVAQYLLVFLLFVVGAALPVLLLGIPRRMNKTAPYWLPLSVVSFLLASVAVFGRMGLLGEMNQAIESRGDFVLLGIVSLAMGMQNGVVSAATQPVVRTTHFTGDSTDLGTELAKVVLEHGEFRKKAARAAWLRFGKIGMFILGAAVMGALEPRWEHLSFFLPSALVAFAAVQSFVSKPKA